MRVLVTGAAGLIGGELVARLAARGHAVSALVHRRHEILDNAGRVLPSRAGGAPGAGEVVTLQGDVRAEGMGLAGGLAVDLVVHSAAVTAFDAADDVYEAVNVGGGAGRTWRGAGGGGGAFAGEHGLCLRADGWGDCAGVCGGCVYQRL